MAIEYALDKNEYYFLEILGKMGFINRQFSSNCPLTLTKISQIEDEEKFVKICEYLASFGFDSLLCINE